VCAVEDEAAIVPVTPAEPDSVSAGNGGGEAETETETEVEMEVEVDVGVDVDSRVMGTATPAGCM